MSGMFGETSMFNQPLNAWDVSEVEKMYGMFAGASSFSNRSSTGTSTRSRT